MKQGEVEEEGQKAKMVRKKRRTNEKVNNEIMVLQNQLLHSIHDAFID